MSPSLTTSTRYRDKISQYFSVKMFLNSYSEQRLLWQPVSIAGHCEFTNRGTRLLLLLLYSYYVCHRPGQRDGCHGNPSFQHHRERLWHSGGHRLQEEICFYTSLNQANTSGNGQWKHGRNDSAINTWYDTSPGH